MPTSPTTAREPLLSRRRTLAALGVVLLLGWAFVWGLSVQRDRLAGGQRTWLRDTPVWKFLGLDFLSNYHAARHWLAGGNPYVEPFGDPLGRPICYPPVILYLFAWCHWLSPRAAVLTWMAALTAL